MYDLIFKPDPQLVGFCLWSVHLPTPDAGRLRDAWIELDGEQPLVAVYTRNGGDNRVDQAEAIARMQSHEFYVRDADDTFDSTYATFYFRLPLALFTELLQAAPDVIHPHIDTDQRWKDAIVAIDAEAVAAEIWAGMESRGFLGGFRDADRS